MLRIRRMRGLGCLGCLPLGGLLPLIIIAAIIYWLVNRRAPSGPAQYPQQPPQPTPPLQPPAAPGGGFCSHCGKSITPGEKFCRGCGAAL